MQDSLNLADRKDVEVLGYVCTRGEAGSFVLVQGRDIMRRDLGFCCQTRDDPLLIGLVVVR